LRGGQSTLTALARILSIRLYTTVTIGPLGGEMDFAHDGTISGLAIEYPLAKKAPSSPLVIPLIFDCFNRFPRTGLTSVR
jgi:hypothetical protein